jgi:hypothetical protein
MDVIIDIDDRLPRVSMIAVRSTIARDRELSSSIMSASECSPISSNT